MTMTDFPTLTRKVDVENFDETQEDPTMRSKTDGGYLFTRPRTTRRPRKSFTIGLIDMPDADKVALQTFWDQVTGSVAFNWTHPVSAEVFVVRLMKPIKFVQTGPGNSHRWDATGIEMEEV